MTDMRCGVIWLVGLAVGAGIGTSAVAADGRFAINIGVDYSTGKYGDTATTVIWALPVVAKYRSDAFTVRLATAWLRVTGPGAVTPDGEPVGPGGARKTTSGVGDVTASVSVPVLDEPLHPVGLDVTAKVKFGTADTAKFLGTGKNDYALQASVFKTVADLTPHLDVGYKWKGDPAGIDYRNVWYASAGADYRFSPRYSAGLDYDWRDRLTPNGGIVSELTAYLGARIDALNKVNLYAVSGFGRASPDSGLGVIFNRGF